MPFSAIGKHLQEEEFRRKEKTRVGGMKELREC